METLTFEKCAYCLHFGIGRENQIFKDGQKRCQLKSSCSFLPDNQGITINDVLQSTLFKLLLRTLRAKLDKIDKDSQVFICGGILTRGYTREDLDVLVVSWRKSEKELQPIKKFFGHRTVGLRKISDSAIWKVVNQVDQRSFHPKLADLLLDIYIYGIESKPDETLRFDLARGLVRMRIA